MAQDSRSTTDEKIIPVVEERLEVGRRVVDTGRTLHVRKRVREQTVEVREPLTSETVDTERVPVGRVLDAPIGVREEGDVLIVPIIEERLVVRKELVLVEEVRITRRRQVHEHVQQATLKRDHVVVERFDPGTGQWITVDEGPTLSHQQQE
jgi:uncharacterized protein (TIGR02271 family)